MDSPVGEQVAVLALVKASPREWYRTASVIDEAGSATALVEGQIGLMPAEQQRYAAELHDRLRPEHLEAADEIVSGLTAQGIRLVTVLDDDYPTNLQLVYNRPPFLWIRGGLTPGDRRAIAVVGTRQASAEGQQRAARLARGFAEAGVTVVSGLARGIDTAAHIASLRRLPFRPGSGLPALL